MKSLVSIFILGAGLFLYALLLINLRVRKKKADVLREDSEADEVQSEPTIEPTSTTLRPPAFPSSDALITSNIIQEQGEVYFKVKDKKSELARSIARLTLFTKGPGFSTIDSVQAMLLLQQLRHMEAYLSVLNSRLARLRQVTNLSLGE